MKSLIELELSDCQAGDNINRGTTDMLFVLQNIIEKVKNTDLDIFITFIDYSKAFDRVDQLQLFVEWIEFGFPKNIVKLISSLYDDQKATIRWDNNKCDFFRIGKGVRRGCILSPHLLSIYTEQVMRQADIDGMGMSIGSRDIADLRYADDTSLIADNQHLLYPGQAAQVK